MRKTSKKNRAWLTGLVASAVLIAFAGKAIATYWCYYISESGGETQHPEQSCRPRGDDPCAGNCYKVVYNGYYICYKCDVIKVKATCGPRNRIILTGQLYMTVCGQNPWPPYQCICVEPWHLVNPQYVFDCYTDVTPGDVPCPY